MVRKRSSYFPVGFDNEVHQQWCFHESLASDTWKILIESFIQQNGVKQKLVTELLSDIILIGSGWRKKNKNKQILQI